MFKLKRFFKKLSNNVFPGGKEQINKEAQILRRLSNNKLSLDKSFDVLVSASGLLSMAKDKSEERMIRYINRQTDNVLNDLEAKSIYNFIILKFLYLPMFRKRRGAKNNFLGDYYMFIFKFMRLIDDSWSNELKIISNDRSVFELEFMTWLLWLTTKKFRGLFNNEDKIKELLDDIHSLHGATLKLRYKMSASEIKQASEKINDRYRGYNKYWPNLDEDADFGSTKLFKLCKKFIENIDSYHNTSFRDSLSEISIVRELMLLFFMATQFLTIDFIKDNYKI